MTVISNYAPPIRQTVGAPQALTGGHEFRILFIYFFFADPCLDCKLLLVSFRLPKSRHVCMDGQVNMYVCSSVGAEAHICLYAYVYSYFYAVTCFVHCPVLCTCLWNS